MLSVERERNGVLDEEERENQPGVVLFPWPIVLNTKWKSRTVAEEAPMGYADKWEK